MKPRTLRNKINRTLFTVALVAFLASAFLTVMLEYRKSRREYSSTILARINVASALMKNALFHTDSQVNSILQSHSGNIDDLLSKMRLFHDFDSNGDSFYILNPQGRVTLISEAYRNYEGLDFSAMIAGTSSSKRQVQHHYQSLLTKKSVVTIQYPLKNGFLLIIERNLEKFIPLMASFEAGPLYEGELFFVLSSNGQTLYHPNRSFVKTRHNLGFDIKAPSSPDDNGLFTFTFQNQKYIGLKKQFEEPSDWNIYYCIPSAVMNSSIQKILLSLLSFLLIFFLVLYFAMRSVFNRYLKKPVDHIVEALGCATSGKHLSLASEKVSDIAEFNTIIRAISSRDTEISKSYERFQTVLDSLDAVVYVADIETYEVLFMNSHARKLSNGSKGKLCYEMLQNGKTSPCEFCTNSHLLDSTGEPTSVHVWEFQNTVNNRWYECRDQAIRWTDGRIVRLEIATDISIRKNAKKKLQEEKELLSVTLRSIGDGVIATDIRGHIVFINEVAQNLCGWTSDEAVGKPSTEIFNIINQKTGLRCSSPVQRVIELGRIMGLANHTILVARDGTMHHIADSGAPIRDSKSKIIGVVLVFRDITHEKKIEEELLKVRKLEAVGVLAGGIAHDFNNILTAILGNIDLATYGVPRENTKMLTLLSDASKATKRATKLTKQLLTFAKGGEPLKEIASLPELITESASFVLHGSQVACTYNIPKELWKVDVDSGQIAQVIQNITINAKHSMPEGGTVTIECTNVHDAASEALLSVDKGDFVRISIRDTGIGIPKTIINKIFDPYFTTKQEGSGLGLAISYSIIHKHDGYLTVHSDTGVGTTFSIYLPAVLSPTEQNTTEIIEDLPATRAARIMFMDDDPMVREIAEAQLKALGHEPVMVNDGVEAINRYQELLDSDTQIDLVIMDLTVPGGMGGVEASRKLLKLDPNAKIIVSSGYSNDPAMANYREHGFSATLAKPFDLHQISHAIASILSF